MQLPQQIICRDCEGADFFVFECHDGVMAVCRACGHNIGLQPFVENGTSPDGDGESKPQPRLVGAGK